MNIKNRILKRMNRHLTWRIFESRNMLTPFATEYWCWNFNGGKIEYTEYYIFGIRIARIRL